VDIVAPEPWTAQESTAVSLMDVQRQSTATTAMVYPCRHHTNQPLVFGEPPTDPWVAAAAEALCLHALYAAVLTLTIFRTTS
jgi:hypothetical protein